MSGSISARRSAAAFAPRPALDLATVALIVGQYAGLAVAYVGRASGWLPASVALLVGFCAMSLAFTAWHEGIHQTLARSRRLSGLLGRLAAIPVLIPYTQIRAHHILHHRYTNDPERDPDHWQLAGPFWSLALRWPRGVRTAREMCSRADPESVGSRADRVQIVLTLGVYLALALASPWGALWAFLAPRLLLVYVHALFINYLPHVALPADRYASSRLLVVGSFTSALMLRHNYHALHHAHPVIPWHRYRRAYGTFANDLAARGVTRIQLGEAWPLLRGEVVRTEATETRMEMR
jgi:ring-1,2-phenylacetyl-CoA epoxidase subunit PaaE